VRKIVSSFLVVPLFFCVGYADTQNDLRKLMEASQMLQQQRIQLTQQYIEAQQECNSSTRGYELNYIGLEPLNRAMGATNYGLCQREERVKRLLEDNKLKLMKVNLLQQEIAKGMYNATNNAI
jgi:hypothetical protein